MMLAGVGCDEGTDVAGGGTPGVTPGGVTPGAVVPGVVAAA